MALDFAFLGENPAAEAARRKRIRPSQYPNRSMGGPPASPLRGHPAHRRVCEHALTHTHTKAYTQSHAHNPVSVLAAVLAGRTTTPRAPPPPPSTPTPPPPPGRPGTKLPSGCRLARERPYWRSAAESRLKPDRLDPRRPAVPRQPRHVGGAVTSRAISQSRGAGAGV